MQEKKGLIAEFKEFIQRGSVLDMAVGIIVGSAFTAIVNSLVNDMLMPLIGVIIGGIDFSGLAVTVGSANITYGNFIQSILNFFFIALAVFLLIKAINSIHSKGKQEETPEEPAPAEDVQLLTEIRDLLAKQQGKDQ